MGFETSGAKKRQAMVIAQTRADISDQKWTLTPVPIKENFVNQASDQMFKLRHKESGKCIDIRDAPNCGKCDRKRIELRSCDNGWGQKWMFNSDKTITNSRTKQAIDGRQFLSEGSDLYMYNKHSKSNQQFLFTDKGALKSSTGDWAFTVASNNNGAELNLGKRSGLKNQEFELVKTWPDEKLSASVKTEKLYWIRHKASGKVLGCEGYRTSAQTDVVLQDKKNHGA